MGGGPWTQEDRMAVGARLRELEATECLNGNQMANALGLSRQTWNNYKTGVANLPLEEARKLKMRFGCSFDWLYIGDGSNNTVGFQAKLDALRRGASEPRPRAASMRIPK